MNRATKPGFFILSTAILLAACASDPPAPPPKEAMAGESMAMAAPALPYYSVQLISVKSEEQARAKLDMAGDGDFVRAEKRGDWYAVRVGAWDSMAEAEEAAKGYEGAIVVHCKTEARETITR